MKEKTDECLMFAATDGSAKPPRGTDDLITRLIFDQGQICKLWFCYSDDTEILLSQSAVGII